MGRILLNNRYGDHIYLEEISENLYKFVNETPEGPHIARVITETDENGNPIIAAYDPSGGPFLELGEPVPGIQGTISSIELDTVLNTYVFKFKL